MTKIDKTDLENIKLIVKESKINTVAKIKIKKNDYEIEITSNDFVGNNVSAQKLEKNIRNYLLKIFTCLINMFRIKLTIYALIL